MQKSVPALNQGHTATDIFDRLEELAYEAAERTVVILDGVNEGRRREWRQAVTTLQALVADRPNIGLIVSCRTPIEPIAIKQKDLENFHKVVHLGFDDQEFDAQAAFFQYYNLPLPEVPLLDREFSRPLTLKLICQSLHSLTGRKLTRGFAGIASGQKGMTYVLESFVNRVGDSIERQYGPRAQGCWALLKGSDQIADTRLAGFAPCMAANMRSYIRPSEADRIIAANYPALRPAQRHQLLDVLRTNGLIEKDAVWYSTKSGVKSRIVFRLPYQRFSDHLIARHLLKTHLDVSSAATIQAKLHGQVPARADLPSVKSIPPRIRGAGLGAGADYRVSGTSQEATSTQTARAILRVAQESSELECILRPVHRRDVLARPCSVYRGYAGRH